MIAACPKCRARYRIEASRLGADGARMRCSQCQAVFRVAPPPPAKAAAPEPTPAPPVATTPARQSEPAQPPAPRPEPRPQEREAPTVVLADSDADAGKRTAQALADWGYSPVLVHDGVEAILTIQRQMPSAVVLDAGLTRMFGFQVCELMKRNESLSKIHVVLIGNIHHEARYRREPNEIYGADAYLERPQLPEALRAVLRGFGLGEAGSRVPDPEPAAVPAPVESPPAITPTPQVSAAAAPPAPVAAPAATEAAPAAESPEIEAARRLARIIVSDIVLYNGEKFEAGLESGDVVGALSDELAEGRSLLAQRVSAEVCESADFLRDELLRVARARGMDG